MRSLLAVALLALFPSCLAAQSFMGGRATVRGGFSHFHNHARFRGGYYPAAFYDPFDWAGLPELDYDSLPAPPPVVVMQQTPTATAAPEPVSPPAQPLLIELRGDRYVQVSSASEEQVVDARPASAREPVVRETPVPQDALLVFRDGHREQVSGYTITDGFLYASGDYYSAGSWNRTIPLSSLNLPETVRENQARGIPFRLPSAPNEVMVGP